MNTGREKAKQPKAIKLREEFEEEFKKIGAGEIFKHFHQKNPKKLKEAIKNFEGDETQLKKWMKSYSVMQKEMKTLLEHEQNGK